MSKISKSGQGQHSVYSAVVSMFSNPPHLSSVYHFYSPISYVCTVFLLSLDFRCSCIISNSSPPPRLCIYLPYCSIYCTHSLSLPLFFTVRRFITRTHRLSLLISQLYNQLSLVSFVSYPSTLPTVHLYSCQSTLPPLLITSPPPPPNVSR